MGGKIALEQRYGATNYLPLPVVLARAGVMKGLAQRFADAVSAAGHDG